MTDDRTLKDLISVGPATIEDFNLLGINTVNDLIGKDPEFLFEELEKKRSQKMDICCLDVFRAAVAQAEDPLLPLEKCRWHYWSDLRKEKAEKV